MTEERTHSLLGGSSMARALACPGSIFLTRDLPPEKASPKADEGTIFHDLMEQELGNFLSFKETGKKAKVKPVKGFSPEMYDTAQQGIRLIWEKVFEYSVTGKVWGFEEEFALNRKLSMAGYVDFYLVYIDDRGSKVLVLIDFKYGYEHVTARGNAQLAFYACAIREEFQKAGKDIDYVRAIIWQPRAYGKQAYEETKLTQKQLDVWKEKFYKVAKQIFIKKKASFCVGAHCQYCRGKPECKEWASHIKDETALQLVNINKIKLPTPEKIPPENQAKIALAADDIISFVKSVKSHVIARYMEGQKFPYLKVVEGSSRRQWIDDEIKVFRGLDKLGITDNYNMKLKGIVEIEKLLAKEHGKEKAAKLLSKFVELSEAPKVLVPEDDERIALKPIKLKNYKVKNDE